MINKIAKSILTLFGIGYSKYAPGTIASFLTCLIWYVVIDYTNIDLFGTNVIYITTFLIILFIYSAIWIDKIYKKKDANEIVVDEFIGQLIPLLSFVYRPDNFIPNCCYKYQVDLPSVIWIVLAFLLFRFFDIFKPFPINIVDKKIKNGLGVMLDDIIAGIYSTIVIYIIYALWF